MTSLLTALVVALIVAVPGLASAGPGARAKLSADLRAEISRGNNSTVEVIVDGDEAAINRVLTRLPLTLKKRLGRGAVLEVPAHQLDALTADPDVRAVAANAVVTSHMALTTATTGADAALAGMVASLGAVNGGGVGVAVIDSGIAAHKSLSGKVVVSMDFTRDKAMGKGRDGYGHGTHIAGIVAGAELDRRKAQGAGGMAPGAHLINLRVLGDDGSGLVADVVEAVDWAIANRAQYNIRIINMSLGAPVTQSYQDDPLGQAVERAVRAGIVVVASAGNRGLTADGKTVLGSVTSPGNSPYAITVGAVRANGTAGRGDDTLAPWSSRGPTQFDYIVKPDLGAPGSLIKSAGVEGSTLADHPSRPHGRQGPLRLHDDERHEPGGGGRERRCRAADRRQPAPDAARRAPGPAGLGRFHAGSGPARRRCRQPEPHQRVAGGPVPAGAHRIGPVPGQLGRPDQG